MSGGESSGSSSSKGYGSSYSQSASLSLPENLTSPYWQNMIPQTSGDLGTLNQWLSYGPGDNPILRAFLQPFGGNFSAPVTQPQQDTLNNLAGAEAGNFNFNPAIGGAINQVAGEAANPLGFAQQISAATPLTPGLRAMMDPGYAASLATGQPTQSVIDAALAPIRAQFNATTAPTILGQSVASGQRPGAGGSSAFGMAFGNAQAQELANESATAGGIVNDIYKTGLNQFSNANFDATALQNQNFGTGLNIAANAPSQLMSLNSSEIGNLLQTLQGQALPQLTEQLGINNALSTYNSSVNSLLSALGLQVQAEQPSIGYASESASNSASFQNEQSSGQQSGFQFAI